MISYETYKLLHLFFIVSFFSSLGAIVTESSILKKKWPKVLLGVVSFLIFVAGMGLIARLGFKHENPFPLWIKLKMANWFVINLLFILLFRNFKNHIRLGMISLILILLYCGIWLAINKPL